MLKTVEKYEAVLFKEGRVGAGGVFLCEIRDSDEFFSKPKSNWEVVKKYFSNKRKSIRQKSDYFMSQI